MSWNVNGIRAVYRNGFLKFLEEYKPDILSLQEIKADKNHYITEKEVYEMMKRFWIRNENKATIK